MEIIGICLFKNEDLFLDLVIQNCYHFCDRLILADNCSEDRSSQIAKSWAESVSYIEYHEILDLSLTHEMLRPYAGKDAWVFGVDGDEIYDPIGLQQLRMELMAGAFEDQWQLYGKVLNVVELSDDFETASGYLARPCRPMNKLYNFRIIDDWKGPCPERLHYGNIIFKPGFEEMNKNQDQSLLSWSKAYFRCLHMVFVPRSSNNDRSFRPNIEQMRGYRGIKRFYFRFYQLLFRKSFEEKFRKEPYLRGELVTLQVGNILKNQND